MSGKIISESEQVKLLGVTIDSNFNFNSHIKEICAKVNQKTSAVAKLRDNINEEDTEVFVMWVVMSSF